MSAKGSIIYSIYPFPTDLSAKGSICQGLYLPRAISAKGSICQGIYLPSLMFNCLSVVFVANVPCPLLYTPRDLSSKPSAKPDVYQWYSMSFVHCYTVLVYCTVSAKSYLPRVIFAEYFVYHVCMVNFLCPLLCLPSALSPKSHAYQVIFMYVLLPTVMSAKRSISQVPCLLLTQWYLCPPTVFTRCYVCHDFLYAQYLLIKYYCTSVNYYSLKECFINPPIAMSAKCYYCTPSATTVYRLSTKCNFFQVLFILGFLFEKCCFPQVLLLLSLFKLNCNLC